MAKFSRFDPRNKKNGRNKKMTLGEYPKGPRRAGTDSGDDKYLRKYKKIIDLDDDPVLQDEVEEKLGWAVG
ncbi:MAG: hypothetical protein CBC55_08935 [Gammaproteobacteria bacterium TMED95]|nr:MAG: hypothetical protein CBC55_08935 [Gammaproteobacteria bacterium TMED95]